MYGLDLRHGQSTVGLNLPDSWEVVYDFQVSGGRDLAWSDFMGSLESPVGTPPLREMVQPGQKVCIVVQDHTRPGPTREAVLALVTILTSAGIKDLDVTVVVGCGTHRVALAEDMRGLLGESVLERVQCLSHNYRDRDSLVKVGVTPFGTPVWVNRRVAEADLVIGVGCIVPHFLAGYAGGAKVILPGVTGLETTAHNHFQVPKLATEPLYGNVDSNPVREDMEAAAKLAGLGFILNFVPDQDGRPVYVVAGDPVKAHRHGVALAKSIYTFLVKAPADVVIANSAPFDVDLNQAAKARSVAALALKPGGSILWLGGCPEGVGFHGLMEDCKQPTLLHDQAKEDVYFFSQWLSREELEQMYGDSVRWVERTSDAMQEICFRKGESVQAIILRAAPLTLVVREKGVDRDE
ncbi:MAG TPA: nickel-dependent lactate racemase [Firmicutes bacterium]|nr:nickel-dependent lactate racemase [Bacillota bacterium]